MKRFSGVIVSVVLVWASAAPGQTTINRLQTERLAAGTFSWQVWRAGDDRVSEFSLPVTFLYPLGPKAGFYAATSPIVSGSLDAVAEYSLSGLSDMKLGGHWLTGRDRILLTFGLNLPSGKSGLKAEEYAVASILAMPAFNFRYPTLGQGPDVQIGISGATEWNGWIVGGGVCGLRKGLYRPFRDVDESYDPGDEVSVSAGAEKEVTLLEKEMRLTGDAMLSVYGDDTWGGEKVFRPGRRLLLQIRSDFRAGPYDVRLCVRDRMRGKNKSGSGESYDLERKNRNVNQFEITGLAGRTVSPSFAWRAVASVRRFSDNDDGTGGAGLFGIGGGIRAPVARRAVLDLEARWEKGSLHAGDGNVGATGLSIGGTVEITLTGPGRRPEESSR
ncbi:hypothetical protein JW777_07925 [bacterium]|nr:hypothetical protein [bacterium]